MNKRLLDLSEEVDQEVSDLLEVIKDATHTLGFPFFVVGAFARDLIFRHGYGVSTGRATEDVDLAVEVSNWKDYEELRSDLLSTKDFLDDAQRQRLLFRNSLHVDIVPFGGVAGPNGEITWPPDNTIQMKVHGFEDALRCTQLVRFRSDPVLEIRVANLLGLAILKLFAWSDRITGRGKDAFDLLFILRNYLEAGNDQKLWNEHQDLVGEDDFDYEKAGARLLGRDIAGTASRQTAKGLRQILTEQTNPDSDFALILDMQKGQPACTFDEILDLLKALNLGLDEAPPAP